MQLTVQFAYYEIRFTTTNIEQQTNSLFHIAHFPHESKRVHAYLKQLLFQFRFVFVSPRHFFLLFCFLSVTSLVFVYFLVIHQLNKWKRYMCVCVCFYPAEEKNEKKKTTNAATKIHVYFYHLQLISFLSLPVSDSYISLARISNKQRETKKKKKEKHIIITQYPKPKTTHKTLTKN